MFDKSSNLSTTVALLKSRANKFSIYGAMIATVTIILATLFSSHQQYQQISFDTLLLVQKNNIVLWLLDAMPFVFAIWGQYAGSLMAYEAGAMVLDQTNQLRLETSSLEHKALHDTTHDPVTDLPNRTLFRDRLQQALARAQREDHMLAVLIVELSNFKEINNTLGHHNGDRMLKKVAARLRGVLRDSDTIARQGGDEFAILLPKVDSTGSARKIAEKIHVALDSPVEIEDLALGIHINIGIALYPEHSFDSDTLQQRADVALYAAKVGKHAIVIYDPKLDQHSPQRLTLMGELRQAISRDELLIHYQPKLDLKNNRVSSMEALVRWQHPSHGFIGPDEFIPLAERTGLIHPLTIWVIDKTLEQIRAWRDNGHNFSVAVNLSAHLLLDHDLPDLIAGKLAHYEVPVELLTLEITESAIMADPRRALNVLESIHDMGIHIAIDDFGTGYSSLAYLSRMTVNEIKIDRSFVMQMQENKRDEKIVHATINLAHNLELSVVAEGVEDEHILEHLRQMECDTVQGYLISRPITADEVLSWLEASPWSY